MFQYGFCIVNNPIIFKFRYTAGNFLGEIIGPISGGILFESYGFERSMSIMGFTSIIFALFFIPLIAFDPIINNEKIVDNELEMSLITEKDINN